MDKDQLPEVTNNSDMPVAPVAVDSQVAESASSVSHEPKSRKKALIVGLIIVLLLGGAAAAWTLTRKKAVAPASSTSVTDSKVTQALQAAPNNFIYYKLGTKVVSYDPKTDKKVVLTEDIPKLATVLDVYADDTSWRVYYTEYAQNDKERERLSYLEKGKTSQVVYEGRRYIMAAANAEKKAVAYSLISSYLEDATAEEKVTTTFMNKDGVNSEIMRSVEGVGRTDPKNNLFLATDISPDATKVIMQKFSCFQCDGPRLATAYELDVASKAVAFIAQSDKAGDVSFDADGAYLISDSNYTGLGGVEGNYKLSVRSKATPASSATVVLDVDEPSWGSLTATPNHDFLAVFVKGKNYTNDLQTVFDGFYKVNGGDRSRVDVTSLDASKVYVNNITDLRGDCYGIMLNRRFEPSEQPTIDTVTIGKICNKQGAYSFSEIEKVDYKVSDPYSPRVVL